MQHSFDISIANKYGVNVAIFLNNLAFWIQRNAANKKHYHDGRYWTYNSVEAYTELFPYWTYKQLRKIIDDCVANDLVVAANYNKSTYDRTKWYAFTDIGLKLFNLTLRPPGQINSPDEPNQNGDLGEPIPDSKPDIKTDKRGRHEKIAAAPTLISSSFMPNEKHKALAKEKALDIKEENEKFMAYYKARRKKMADWEAAFESWLRKCIKFDSKSKKPSGNFNNEAKAAVNSQGFYVAQSREEWFEENRKAKEAQKLMREMSHDSQGRDNAGYTARDQSGSNCMRKATDYLLY
jgi:hypothetical protein